MAIKVQCACGKAFAAKDELAGKTVKCPSCQQPLKIATAGAGNHKAPAPKAAAPAAKPAAAPKAAPASPRIDDLFDELGLAPPEEGTRPCPGCSEPMSIEAVLCVKCGYNTRIGRRMHTEVSTSSGAEGHGAVAQDLLDKAADVLEGDEEAEKTKTNEGMPWWVYLVILIVLISIAAAMIMRPSGKDEESEEKTGSLARAARALV